MIYHVSRTNQVHGEKPCVLAVPTWTVLVHEKPDYWPYDDANWQAIGRGHCEINGREYRNLGRVGVWAVEIPDDEALAQFERDHGEIRLGKSGYDLTTPTIEILDDSEPPALGAMKWWN